MKFPFLILTAFMTLSCGKAIVSNDQNTRLGATLEIAVLSTNDKNNLTIICNALKEKSLVLPQSIGTSLVYNTTQTDCENRTVSQGDQEVVVTNNNGYVYKLKSNNLEYIFPDIETENQGVFQNICAPLAANPAGFSNPVPVQTVAANVYANNVPSTDCPFVNGESCVQFNITDGQGKVITKEWIRFRYRSNTGRIGFYTYRKKVTQGTCADNKFITHTAVLK